MDNSSEDEKTTATAVVGLFVGTAVGTVGCWMLGGFCFGLRTALQWSAVFGSCGCVVGLLAGAAIGVCRQRAAATEGVHPTSLPVAIVRAVAIAIGTIIGTLGAYPVHLWPVPDDEPEGEPEAVQEKSDPEQPIP